MGIDAIAFLLWCVIYLLTLVAVTDRFIENTKIAFNRITLTPQRSAIAFWFDSEVAPYLTDGDDLEISRLRRRAMERLQVVD